MERPLEGIKVVELSTYVAAPVAAKMLGEWGADVIKVEPPFGDEYRYIGATLRMPIEPQCNPNYDLENSGKRSLALNLKSEAGFEVLDKLLAGADVLITNYRPEALIKLGLDYDTLKVKYPKLVYAQVVGYGLKGPDREKPGFDLTSFFARSGIMIDAVEKDTAPMSTMVAVGDHVTGTALVSGVCAALYKQAKTGQGDLIVSGLYQNSLYICSSMIAAAEYGAVYPISHEEAVSPLVNSYQCKDGEWILLAGTSYDKYWEPFCLEILERPDLLKAYAGVPNMLKFKKEMIALLDQTFASEDRDYWEHKLIKADIANEKVLHWIDVKDDEQAIANNYIERVEYDNGKVANLVNTPVDFGSFEKDKYQPSAMLGEHSEQILSELGYAEDVITSLRMEKIIK